MYLVKKKRDDVDADVGCTNCNGSSMCLEDCVCRYYNFAVHQKLNVYLLVVETNIMLISC